MSAALFGLAALLAAEAGPAPLGIGDKAPALEIVTPDGQTAPAPKSGDEAVVVDFFATWCGPCHQALRDLVAIRTALGPRVRFVLVDAGEDPATVQAFIARNPLPAGAAVTIDPSGEVMRRWGCKSFPTTFLVDGNGIVRHINRGWGGGYQARLLRWLREMLGDVPAGGARRQRPVVRSPEGPPSHEVVKGVEILRGP